MDSKKFNPGTGLLLLMIGGTGLLRVLFNWSPDLSPLAVFSPIGAMALFGGAYFNGHAKAFGFPLLTLFLSDVILHQTVFKPYSSGLLYHGWYWVYGAIALMTLCGRVLMKKPSISRFLIAALVCTFIHWTITDLGVFLNSVKFAPTVGGYLNCLELAIPFELRFLSGTLIYGVILFGSFEWIRQEKALPTKPV